MRLIEAIIDANRRAVAGDRTAGIHPNDYADELPLVALTCIDPRLNLLFPGALGLTAEQFIWLRNAGNIIFGPMSTMMRSLALACAVKGGKEIAVIGHTDCRVRHTSLPELIEAFKRLGVPRDRLPGDLTEFFGVFTSERDNVLRSCDYIRQSPLIGPRVPIHGLMIDVGDGGLEWIVNGYDTLARAGTQAPAALQMPAIGAPGDDARPMPQFRMGEMKFPEMKIGESATVPPDIAPNPAAAPAAPAAPAPKSPPRIPVPPPIPIRKKR